MSDYPNQDYFVSAKLRLIVRFDDLGADVLRGKAPEKTTPRLNGVKDERTPLVVQEDPDSPPGVKRFILVGRESDLTSNKTVAPVSSADGFSHEITGVVPKTATFKMGGIRTADTLTASIRYLDFPFHPILIRACAVEFYLGTLTSTEFAEGVRGITRGDVFGSGSPNKYDPMNLVPDTYLDDNGRSRTNLRFQGWVDNFEMTADDTGISMVKLSCTDNTRLLIKQKAPPKLNIAMDLPIDEAVAQYLSHFPQMEGMGVVYSPTGARTETDPPRLKASLANTAFRPQLGPPPAKSGASSTGTAMTVLDYLTDVCGAIGHVVYVDGVTVVIRRPRTLLDGTAQPREDDPYRVRELDGGTYPVRAYIYGKNVKSMEFKRSLGTEGEPKNIEVRSYSPRRKRVLIARWPDKDARVNNSPPGDGKVDQEWRVVKVSGIEDQETLSRIAQAYYEVGGRQELSCPIKLRNLSSFGGGNSDPDVLDLKVGDSVEVLVDRNAVGGVHETEDKLTSVAKNKNRLLELGFDQDLADTYAGLYTAAGFQRYYRVRTGQYDWDVDQGVTISLETANYIEIRLDQPQPVPDGESPTAPK